MADLLALALLATEDQAAVPVLADAVQEAGWFDPRVMQVMWPLGKAPRDGWRTKKKRDRAKVDREAHKTGYPYMFAGFAAKPTTGWARAIASVLLFGGFRKRRWPLIEKMRKDLLRRPRLRADSENYAVMRVSRGTYNVTFPKPVRTIVEQYRGE